MTRTNPSRDGYCEMLNSKKIRKLEAELKAKDEVLKVILRNVKSGAVTTTWVEQYITQYFEDYAQEQALKGEQKSETSRYTKNK